MKDINLLPQEARKNKQTGNRKFYLYGVILLIMVSAYMGVYLLNYNIQSNIKNDDDKIAGLQDIRIRKDKVREMNKDIEVIKDINKNFMVNNTNYYDLLLSIEDATPAKIHFSEQTCTAGMMTIKGTAVNEQLVSQFAANLSLLKNISEVRINTTQFDDEISFDISFIYNEQERAEVQ